MDFDIFWVNSRMELSGVLTRTIVRYVICSYYINKFEARSSTTPFLLLVYIYMYGKIFIHVHCGLCYLRVIVNVDDDEYNDEISFSLSLTFFK